MDKAAIKQAMLELTEEQMAQATGKYQEFLKSARLSQDETIDDDEQAQAVAAAEVAISFDDQLHEYSDKVEQLERTDFGARDTVSPGAIIQMGERFLVIAVSTAAFSCEGKSFIGISTAAPIYQALEGNKAGDICAFNGKNVHIGAIY